jgi:uncharacterized repeat protein (TIGR01451 family)
LYQVSNGIFQRFNRTTNTYIAVGTPMDFDYSIGYRKADGFIYGIVTPSTTLGSDGSDSNGTPVVVGDLVQVDANGQVVKLVSTGTPITDNHDAVAIHEGNGTLWARTGPSASSTQLSEFNLSTGAVLNTLTVTNGGVVSGDLIIVGNTAYRWWTDVMYSIPLYGPTAGQATVVPMIGTPTGTRGSGAAFALTDPDNPGSVALYWPESVTGDLYKITGFTTGNPVAVRVGSTPPNIPNDGTSCDSATSLFLGDDYSDAPNGFGVAAHGIDSSLRLGATVTADNGALQDADNASDDGIATFPVLNATDSSYSVNATVTNTSGTVATLHAWIDLDRNGVFDSDEHTSVAVPNGTNGGTVTLNWASLPGLTSGASQARFRLTTDTLTAANPSTAASDGEVEDYALNIIGISSFSIAGKVYHDADVNGVNNSEAGIKNITMVLYDTAANTCQSTRTAADGSYRFNDLAPAAANNYIVYEAAAETLPEPRICPPVEADPNGFIFTTPNSLAVTVSTANVSGVDFGDVKQPQFTLEHSQAILPGSTVTYPHLFKTSATGTVSFSLAELADPASLSWEASLFIDTNCNAQLEGGDLPLTGSLAVNAGDTLCLLAKVLAPTNVSSGASYTLEVTSQFTYGDGSLIPIPVEQRRTDLTRTNAGTPTNPVDGAGKLKLTKFVWNATQNRDGDVALPGETLRYTIAYENIGNGALDELIVYDRVPTYTQFVGASQQCGTTPPELSACTPLVSDENLEWRFVGQLLPGSQGEVLYEVIVE